MALSKWQMVGISLSLIWVVWAGVHEHREDVERADSSANFAYRVCENTKRITHDTNLASCKQKQEETRALYSQGRNGNIAIVALAPIPFAWLTVFILVYAFRIIRTGFRAVVPWQALPSWKKGFVILCGVFSGGALLAGGVVVMNLYVDQAVPVVMGNAMVVPFGTESVTAKGTWTRSGRDAGSAIAYPLQTSEIRCYRDTKRCAEARAFVSGNVLMTDLVQYEVESWTATQVVFKNEDMCATDIFTIDLNSEMVSGAGHRTNNDKDFCKFSLIPNPETEWTYRLADGFKVYWEKRSNARPMPLRVIQAFFGN